MAQEKWQLSTNITVSGLATDTEHKAIYTDSNMSIKYY